MSRWIAVAAMWVGGLLSLALVFAVSQWWLALTIPLLLAAALGAWDLAQQRHSVLRNYPVLGHARFLFEAIRPEIEQYFIERNTEGVPFDRDTRTTVYERAKGTKDVEPFGTERDVTAVGYEYFTHSLRAHPAEAVSHGVVIGGPDCSQPYRMALYNVSAMSYGALSGNAIEALNGGAARGGFAQDTGEGGLSQFHLKHGGDLIWEIGSGYFGTRTTDGRFDPTRFADKAAHPQVKCVSIKLSQGAKPGLGGVLPGAKVTQEIADARGVPVGKTVVSPPSHSVFRTPRELCAFIGELRRLSDGKPIGLKLCVGSRVEFLGICKAIIDTGVAPDFIIVDGAEGGTGAAPIEFEDHVGMPLTEGLMLVHNALVGAGLRAHIKVGASGKVALGSDIVKRVIQGADFTLAARAMMFAVGCIQAQRCHTNRCPVGVTTQDPRRARALNVPDKTTRVYNFQRSTVASAQQIVASMGLRDFGELTPAMLNRRVDGQHTRTYEELYEWLPPRGLLPDATTPAQNTPSAPASSTPTPSAPASSTPASSTPASFAAVPDSWRRDWERADADQF